MISRRNFAVITIIMVMVLFLFQFSQIVKSSGNEFMNNDYSDLKFSMNHEWEAPIIKLSEDGESSLQEGNYILFVGDVNSNVGSVVKQWTTYTKRALCVVDSISEYVLLTEKLPEFLIIDSSNVDYNEETDELIHMTDEGVSIVFCTLPDSHVIDSNAELKKIMGVNYVKEPEITVEGIHLFSGFLLGGETIYQPKKKSEEFRQDMDLTMPWYVTAGGTKTYMVGMMDEYYGEYEYKNDYFPAIIWRNSLGNAQVFCVCGDYMSQTSGLGILSAMIYELSDYQLYPIVNAQNTLLVNFPILANENEQEFKQIYSRSVESFQADVIWPTLISLSEKYGMRYTAFVSPKYDYKDAAQANPDVYYDFLEKMHERRTEVGASLQYAKGTLLQDKLGYDEKFYTDLDAYLETSSAFINIEDADNINDIQQKEFAKNIRTVACKEDIQIPILSYLENDVTLQSLTSDTKKLTYTRDLRLKSIETTLGYDNAELNFSDVIWPVNEEDHWQNIYTDMSSALTTYWKPFGVFDKTTLTESDQRVRVFLNMDYEQSRDGDSIALHVKGRDGNTCWFLLRTHGEKIIDMTGGSFEKVEDGTYMLTIEADDVILQLESVETMNLQ